MNREDQKLEREEQRKLVLLLMREWPTTSNSTLHIEYKARGGKFGRDWFDSVTEEENRKRRERRMLRMYDAVESLNEEEPSLIQAIWFDSAFLWLAISDGRQLAVPLSWFPRLAGATEEQRHRYRFIAGGEGVHWEEIDEDISLRGLLRP